MELLVTGSLAYDRIMDFGGEFKDHILPDKIHAINVAFYLHRLEERRGGTAGNIAYNLHLLGEQPRIIASAGSDFDSYMKEINALGLNTDHIEVQDDLTTASAYIFTDKSNNQITGFLEGAMGRETSTDLAQFEADNTYVILSPTNPADMVRYAADAARLGIKYLFDPGQQVTTIDEEQMATYIDQAHSVFVNDYEFEIVKQVSGYSQQDIIDRAELLVVTRGKEGSQIFTKDGVIDIPPAPVSEVNDPTGAGDAYRAGFMKGYAHGESLEVCGRMGAVASSYVIEQYGTQEHSYTIEEYAARYAEAFPGHAASVLNN